MLGHAGVFSIVAYFAPFQSFSYPFEPVYILFVQNHPARDVFSVIRS